MKKETLSRYYLTYRVQIFTVVVALSSLFLIIFVIYPQTVKLLSNQKRIGELSSKSKFLENKVSALENFDEAELSQKVGYVLTTFPQEKDLGNTLSILKLLTEQSGFSINAITFGSAGGKLGNLDTYGVKIEIKGPKIMLSSLLNNLENSPRLLRVSNIEVSSSQTSQSSDTGLVLDVIYSSSLGGSSSVDAPLSDITPKDEELIAKLAKMNRTISGFDLESIPRGKSNPFE